MSRAVKLSDHLIKKAKMRAYVMSRSTARQIEYWANIGSIAEDNPDLSYAFVKNLLISLEESKQGETEDYVFGEGDAN